MSHSFEEKSKKKIGMKSVSLRLVIKTAHEGYTEQDTPTHSSTYTDAHINHEADTHMIKNNGYDLTAIYKTELRWRALHYITYSLTPHGRSRSLLKSEMGWNDDRTLCSVPFHLLKYGTARG